jgi:DNA helicase-2/ATP-dependent DNA helicase PcrA
MQNLSIEQQDIVDTWVTNGGALVVSASAGSGKTRILTECARRIINGSPKDRFRILCLTFTNKAAEEMLRRLENLKGIKDRAFINTIHAFGLEVVMAYRHELGYENMPHIVEREADRKEILKGVFLQSPLLEPIFSQIPENSQETSLKKYQEDLLNKTLNWISTQKRNLIHINNEVYEYPSWKEKHLHLYKEYNQHLQNQQLIEFDDILLLAWRILNIPSIVSIYRRLYRYVMIDEAQDLNFAQYEFLRSLCGDSIRNILMVGDGNQAIHGYAGSDKKYMFEDFVRDFRASQKNIEKNYRSSKSVLSVAYTVIQGKHNNINEQYYDGFKDVRSFESETEESLWIINKIKGLLVSRSEEFEGKVTLDKIAILSRNKFVFNNLREVLDADSDLSECYFLKRGNEVVEPESTIMKVFDLGTRIMANYQGEVYWKQLLTLLQTEASLQSSGLESLQNITNTLKISIEPVFNFYSNLLEAWRKIDTNISYFPSALKFLMDQLSVINNDQERSLAQSDIEEWMNAWEAYIRSSSGNRTLADFRRFTAMGFNKPGSEKGLTLATVHTVKGLEFDIVFLMGMSQGTFPDYRALRSGGKAMDEEKNNAYVAITRAKRHIYITFPKNKKMPWGSDKSQEPSQFLNGLEINEGQKN